MPKGTTKPHGNEELRLFKARALFPARLNFCGEQGATVEPLELLDIELLSCLNAEGCACVNSSSFLAKDKEKLLVLNDGTHRGGLFLNPRQPASSQFMLCLCCRLRCSNYPHGNPSVGRKDPCSQGTGLELKEGTMPRQEASSKCMMNRLGMKEHALSLPSWDKQQVGLKALRGSLPTLSLN